MVDGNYESMGPTWVSWWWAGEKHDDNRANSFGFSWQVPRDTLSDISLTPNSDIVLAEVLAARGLPDKVTVWKRRCVDFCWGTPPGYDLELLYTELGIEISWEFNKELPDDPPTINVCPEPDYPALAVNYYTLETAQAMSDANPLGMTTAYGAVYSGDALATVENGVWTIKCLQINNK